VGRGQCVNWSTDNLSNTFDTKGLNAGFGPGASRSDPATRWSLPCSISLHFRCPSSRTTKATHPPEITLCCDNLNGDWTTIASLLACQSSLPDTVKVDNCTPLLVASGKRGQVVPREMGLHHHLNTAPGVVRLVLSWEVPHCVNGAVNAQAVITQYTEKSRWNHDLPACRREPVGQ
jgi:hypothetical protein